MKISCQTCQSKYTVSDEKVQGKTVKIKCRKCGATILVNSNGVTTSAAGAADAVADVSGDAGSFLVNLGENDQRSMSLQEVVAAYNGGVVTADTYIWVDGATDWAALSAIDSIVAALHAPTASAPPAEPSGDVSRPAARRDAARRATDLFGGGMAAQAADDVQTSAPVIRAGTPMPAAAPSASKMSGDENSMLFSLSALTAKAPASSVSKTIAKNDDSGLIDLRALADSAGSAGPTNLVPDHAGLFPLGAPPAPLSAPAVTAHVAAGAAPSSGNKTPLFIGMGVAIASIAIVGAFFAMKNGGEKPVAAVAPPPPEVTASAAATVASAAPTASAPTAVASTDPSAVASAASAKPAVAAAKPLTGRLPPASGGNRPAGASAPAAAAPAPTPAAGGKKGNCGCAGGDLMCAMRCSAH